MATDCCVTQYVLVEANNFSSILTHLKSSLRVKYTSFDVSQSFIIFGATSGGLYIFNREPCHFLQLLPNKDGPINNVSISPDERFIGFSTLRGVCSVLQRNDEGGANLVNRSVEHKGNQVTAITWSPSSHQVFFADDTGQLSITNVSLFMNKSIFQLPSHVFMKLDSGIIQVSCYGDSLLVSTRTRCYLCDTAKEQYKQIGTKLREGDYGACFFKKSSGFSSVFCARPGSRLWEVDMDGSVLSTHQFKKALAVKPGCFISLLENNILSSDELNWPERSFNFPILLPFMDNYVLTFNQDGFYIFDTDRVGVVTWSNHFNNIIDVKCISDSIYVWCSEGEVRELVLTSIEKCLLQLYFKGSFDLCVQLCAMFANYISSLSAEKLMILRPLTGLPDHINKDKFNAILEEFFDNLNNCVNNRQLDCKLNESVLKPFVLKEDHLCENGHHEFHTSENNTHIISGDAACVNFVESENDTTDSDSDIISSRDLKMNNAYGSVLESSFCNCSDFNDDILSQIPFLSLTSPDLIHKTILELGSSVSGKFFYGTRSLINKWQVFEGKFKFLKNDVIERNNDSYLPVKDSKVAIAYPCDDEDAIVQRDAKLSKPNKKPNIDTSPLLELCELMKKSENGRKSDIFVQLIECTLKTYNEYHKLLISDNKSNKEKLFPFRKCLSLENVDVIQEIFHEVMMSGKIKKCLQILPEDLINSTIISFQYPDLLLDFHSANDLKYDIALSNILFILVEILDPFKVLQCLQSANLPCSFLSWNVILEAFQESTFDYIVASKEPCINFIDWPLPLILNTIFLMLRLDQVESVCHIAKEGKIKLKDISYLILKLQLHLISTGHNETESRQKCNDIFLTYISKMIELNNEDRNGLLHCDETLFHVENAVFDLKIEYFLCSSCQYPVIVKGHKLPFQLVGEVLLELILKNPTKFNDKIFATDLHKKNDKSYENDLHTVSNLEHQLKKKIHFDIAISKIIKIIHTFPSLLIALIKNDIVELHSVLNLIVQFNLLNLTDPWLFMFTIEDWQNICDHFLELSKGICCNCHSFSDFYGIEVDWNLVAISLLKSQGPAVTIKLLMEYSNKMNNGTLDLSFYRASILRSLINDASKPDVILDTYCKQLIKHPIDSEMSQDGAVSTWEAESSDGLSPEIVYSKDRRHWGITLDVTVDVCSRCSLILNSEKLLQEGGLRAFRCGHVYHVVCLRLCNSLYNCTVCS